MPNPAQTTDSPMMSAALMAGGMWRRAKNRIVGLRARYRRTAAAIGIRNSRPRRRAANTRIVAIMAMRASRHGLCRYDEYMIDWSDVTRADVERAIKGVRRARAGTILRPTRLRPHYDVRPHLEKAPVPTEGDPRCGVRACDGQTPCL